MVGVEVVIAVAMLETPWLMLMTCWSSLSCANCETNCVPSSGFKGYWFCNWATSNCKNVF